MRCCRKKFTFAISSPDEFLLLWTNGWMHQDATWYGGRPQPRQLCVIWRSSALPKKRRRPSIFGPRLLWPKGCIDQDATWYGGRSRFARHCVRWSPAPPPLKGCSPQFSANVRCGQTAGWTKMPLGVEVGLGPGDFVFDGDPAPPEKRLQPPIFRPCLL